jgi:hypothetical protein
MQVFHGRVKANETGLFVDVNADGPVFHSLGYVVK